MLQHLGRFSCESVTEPASNASFDSEVRIDERVVIYAQTMRKPFDELCRAAAQVAGLLVLAAAGSRASSADHPMLATAAEAYGWANETVRVASVPPAGQHHHLHLSRAASWLGATLQHCRSAPHAILDVDGTLPLLRQCWRELRLATIRLPGFEIVAVEQACCRDHRTRVQIPLAGDWA
jgi:hypothetical protein